MKKRFLKPLLASSVALVMMAGCTAPMGATGTPQSETSKAQQGAMIGALLGAVVGATTGGNTNSTTKRQRALIGAAAGAAAGYGIGYSLDQQAKEVAQVLNTNVNNNPSAEKDASQNLIVSNTDKYVKIMFRDSMMFATNSSVPTSSAQSKINELYPVLQKYQTTLVQSVGHTDNRGSFEYNLNLSNARATSVANSIKTSGVPNQVFAKGCSFSKPIASNSTESDMALNRRVEVYLYPNEASVIDPCKY
ncbi:MAG: membrane protein [Sulfurovum sp. AS07-7]|nr:MAG: membrane protein [Sulfurovum sp. AS07-7]